MMTPEVRAAVGRIVDHAARQAETRDAYELRDPSTADALARSAINYGHAAAYALDTELCDVSTALAPEWAGNDMRTDRAGYAARLWIALGRGSDA